MATNNQQTLRPLTGAELNRIADRLAARLGQQVEDLMLSVFDEWMTVEDLAAYLSLSTQYITRNADLFGGIKLDKRWYFSRKNINDLLKAQPQQLSLRERELVMQIRQARESGSFTEIRKQLNELRKTKSAGAKPSVNATV